MICTFCGHDNEPGVKFCARCGAQVQQLQQAAEPANIASYSNAAAPSSTAGYGNAAGYDDTPDYDSKRFGAASSEKNLPIKKILIIAIPAIVIIIAAIILISMLSGSGGGSAKNHLAFFTDRGETIISGNNNAKITIDGEMYSNRISMDGSKAVALLDYSPGIGGSLWFVTPSSEPKLIADDVYAYMLADSGKGVAYFTDYDSRYSLATLYLYDTASDRSTLITEYAYHHGYSTMPGVAISPDGNSIGYISDFDLQNSEFTGFIKIDGKSPEKLGDESLIFALSDSGKYLYYCKQDVKSGTASLHVKSGRNENRLISDLSGTSSIMLNKDYSEIIYNSDGRTYISRRGGERERISGATVYSLVQPRGTQEVYTPGDISGFTVYGVSTFSNFAAITEEGLAYYNSKLEPSKIANSDLYAGGAEISSDGKTLYYITNTNRLSSIDPTVPGAERRELEKNILSFVASSDGKSVYYVNDDYELYYMSGKGTPTKISDDIYVENYGSYTYAGLAMSYSSNRVFFLVEYSSAIGGELYYSNNGAKRVKVSGGNDITEVWSTPANIFYTTVDDELFRSNGNEKFSLFHDEIDR